MPPKTSETAQTLPVMKAVHPDPASMAQAELERLREENKGLRAALFMARSLIEELQA